MASPDFNAAERLLEEVKRGVSGSGGSVESARGALAELKIALVSFPSLPTSTERGASWQREVSIARETFEQAVLLSAKLGDGASLERHYAQVRPYHMELRRESGGDGETRLLVTGMFLMHLLTATGRSDEFHLELEALPEEDRKSPYVAFPEGLDSHLAEGAYNKALLAVNDSPTPLFEPFLQKVQQTVRLDISAALEAAYPQISVSGARKLLHLESDREMLEFAATHHPKWTRDGDNFIFVESAPRARAEIPAQQVVQRTLEYATELERIV